MHQKRQKIVRNVDEIINNNKEIQRQNTYIELIVTITVTITTPFFRHYSVIQRVKWNFLRVRILEVLKSGTLVNGLLAIHNIHDICIYVT